MLVAALDTSTLTLSCALVDVSRTEAPRLRRERTARTGPAGRRGQVAAPEPAAGREADADVAPVRTTGHSALLPRALVELLKEEGLAIPGVEAYAVGLGPGSFTGLRIGLATWKGLAYANRRPIAGASSLAAMALGAARDAQEGALLVPLLDARKGEVYAGFYRVREGGIVELADDAALPPAAVAERARALTGGPAAGFGEGYEAYAQVLEPGLPRLRTEVRTPAAFAVAALVSETVLAARYDPQALFALEPHYVRPSEAELKFPGGNAPTVPGAGKGS